MEKIKSQPTTEDLRLGLIKRAVLLVFGCIATSVGAVILPALYFVAVRTETSYSVTPGTAPVPQPPSLSFGAFIPPLVLLALVGLIIYGIFDMIRVYGLYRKSQQNDQMFP